MVNLTWRVWFDLWPHQSSHKKKNQNKQTTTLFFPLEAFVCVEKTSAYNCRCFITPSQCMDEWTNQSQRLLLLFFLRGMSISIPEYRKSFHLFWLYDQLPLWTCPAALRWQKAGVAFGRNTFWCQWEVPSAPFPLSLSPSSENTTCSLMWRWVCLISEICSVL